MPSSWMYVYAVGEKGQDQRLVLFSTDMVAMTLVSIPATVSRLGSVSIRPKLLIDFLSNLPKTEEVEISSNGGNLEFKSGLGKGKIPGSKEGDTIKHLIDLMPSKEKPSFEVLSDSLVDLIGSTEFCTTDSRYLFMTAINLKTVQDGYVAEATDGSVMGIAHVKDEKSPGPGQSALIPGYGLIHLKSLLAKSKGELIQVVFDKGTDGKPTKVFFKSTKMFFGISLLTDAFPDTSSTLKAAEQFKSDKPFRIKFETLRQALQRAIPFAEDGKMKIALADKSLTISVSGAKTGSFSATVEGEDAELKIAHTMYLNARYLLPVLMRNHGTILTINTSTNGSKTWLTDDGNPDSSTTYLLACVAS